MKRQSSSESVAFSLGPPTAREGWEVARITYDAANPAHLAQVEAAVNALVAERTRQGLARAGEGQEPASD